MKDAENPKFIQYTHVRFDALLFGCVLRLFFPFLLKIQNKLVIFRMILFVIGSVLFVGISFVFIKIRWWDFTLAYLASGSLILSGVLLYRPLIGVLENPLIKFLGQCSYGIYLWHYVIVILFYHMYSVSDFEWLFYVYPVFAVLLGVATTKTIEDIFLRIRHQRVP